LWIDFTRKKSPQRLKKQIHGWIMDTEACLCEPIAFEILRHATQQEYPLLEAQFDTLPVLETPHQLWRDAASLGRTCRQHGITAGSLDLLIATIASHYGAELITFDHDFMAISQVSDLQVLHLQREPT
jgi:predicted nucleic acid-binding protein